MNDGSIGLYQTIYSEAVRSFLDPGFIPLERTDNPEPELRELGIHSDFFEAGLHRRHALSGIVSPKLFSKTMLRFADIHSWIESSPGYELYIINGRPFIPYTVFNGMELAERAHGPNFEQKFRRMCSDIGMKTPDTIGRQNNANTVYCSYWCGSRAFWERWGHDVLRPLRNLQYSAGPSAALFSIVPYPSPTPVYNVAFFYERLLSVYLQSHAVRYLAFPWDAERVLALDYHPLVRDYLEAVVPWVDEIERTNSWTAARCHELSVKFEPVRTQSGVEGHEVLAFDPLDFNLPRHNPNRA